MGFRIIVVVVIFCLVINFIYNNLLALLFRLGLRGCFLLGRYRDWVLVRVKGKVPLANSSLYPKVAWKE